MSVITRGINPGCLGEAYIIKPGHYTSLMEVNSIEYEHMNMKYFITTTYGNFGRHDPGVVVRVDGTREADRWGHQYLPYLHAWGGS